MKLNKAISIRLNNLLKEKNIKQCFIFQNGGVPRSTISNVVNCGKKRIRTDTIYQICAAMNISLSDFFNDEVFENIDD